MKATYPLNLPPLVFGEHDAQTDFSANAMGDRLSEKFPWRVDFDAIGDSRQLRHHSSSANPGDLALPPMRAGNLNFDVALRHLCRSVHLYAATPSFLAVSATPPTP